jgi:hypothetical protein
MATTEAAPIAGLSAIGGGLIVAASNLATTRIRMRAGRHAELRRLLLDLLIVVGRIDDRLRIEPVGGRAARAIYRAPQLDHTLAQTRRWLLDPR